MPGKKYKDSKYITACRKLSLHQGMKKKCPSCDQTKSCLNFLQDWKDKNEKGSLSNNNDTGYINVGKTSMEINNSLCNINLTLSAVFKKR